MSEQKLHPLLIDLIVKYPELAECTRVIEEALEILKNTYRQGGKFFFVVMGEAPRTVH